MPVVNCTPHSTAIIGSSGFDPRSPRYGDLMGYYDANDITTTFQDDGTATPATAVGDPVRRWYAKYGNGAPYFSTASLTNAPTRQVMAGTPLVGLRADGTDDYLTSSSTNFWKSLHDGTGFTCAMYGYVTDASPESEFLIYDNINGSSATPGIYLSYNDAGAVENRPYVQLETGGGVLVSNNADAGLNDKLPTQTPVILVIGYDYVSGTTTSRVRTWSSVNNAQVGSTSSSARAPSSSNPSYALRLFATAVSAGFRAKMTLTRIAWWSGSAGYESASEIARGISQ